MATGCPNNNCVALANWPRSELLDALAPHTTAKRAAAAAAASPKEYYAAVASPTLQPGGVPYNRVTLVVNVLTKGSAIRAYRQQLVQALETLDKAVSAGLPSVEIAVQVPDELSGGGGRKLAPLAEESGPPTGTQGTGKGKGKDKAKDGKGPSGPKKKKKP
jgi:hypothetical protein